MCLSGPKLYIPELPAKLLAAVKVVFEEITKMYCKSTI